MMKTPMIKETVNRMGIIDSPVSKLLIDCSFPPWIKLLTSGGTIAAKEIMPRLLKPRTVALSFEDTCSDIVANETLWPAPANPMRKKSPHKGIVLVIGK